VNPLPGKGNAPVECKRGSLFLRPAAFDMTPFSVLQNGNDARVLVIGAHCDDIEIGCGGTLHALSASFPAARILWVTLSSDEAREAETRNAAARLLGTGDNTELRIERFRGSYFPYDGAAIKDYFETLKAFRPELILTHARDDLHQDHRVVNELTWNTFRNHAILEYEIPKYDGDIGNPNMYVPMSRRMIDFKTATLLECFPSQRGRQWFTRETFEGLARIRGIECNAREGFAEAFYCRKAIIGF
jgi:LmbE family N-acetylglucosaminyl deacetylase